MHDDWDDSNYTAQTIKPAPRFSQRITAKIPPPLPIKSIIPNPPKKNWDPITLIVFAILILIAAILYIYVNRPFKDPANNIKIIQTSEPVLTAYPVKPIEKQIQQEQKIETVNPISSSQVPTHIIKKHKIVESKDKDYGI